MPPTPRPTTSEVNTKNVFTFAMTGIATIPLGMLPKDAPPVGITRAGCLPGEEYCDCAENDFCESPLTCAERATKKRCECLLGSIG